MPCCSDLRNPALLPRHWDKIDALVGRHIERDPEQVSRMPGLHCVRKEICSIGSYILSIPCYTQSIPCNNTIDSLFVQSIPRGLRK